MFRKIRKIKNEIAIEETKALLRNNKRAAFSVNGDDGDWAYHVSSCVVFGRARLVDDSKTTEEKMRNFALKYYPSAEDVEEEIKSGIKGVQLVEIEIEHISGKKVYEK